MNFITVLLLSIILPKTVICKFSDSPIVSTSWGLIQGTYQVINETRIIKAFLGIPYGLPPAGPLRYKPSIPLFRPYKGVYRATNFGPACMQNPLDAIVHADNATLSENCLFLNIWSPVEATPDKPLPVLSYIHGSGHVYGSTSAQNSRGDYLAAFGNIVVVTMNYRLGALGLAFSDNKAIPGNMAISDVLLALQWIRKNIRSFGGDPDQVTLGGMSTGAIYASAIFISPSTPFGLFNKLVLMSGVPADPVMVSTPSLAFNLTKGISAHLGCTKFSTSEETFSWRETVCLTTVPAESITTTAENSQYTSIYGDQFFMPLPPKTILAKGGLKRGFSILIGTEQDESIKGFIYAPNNFTEARDNLKSVMYNEFYFSSDLDFDPIIYEYYKNVNESDKAEIRRVFHAFISDAGFHCPSLLFGEKFATLNTVHMYRNEYITSNAGSYQLYGTLHSNDARLFLGKPFRLYNDFTDEDRQVSLVMMKTLGLFVKGQSLPWPGLSFSKNGTQFNRWKIQNGASYNQVDPDPDSEICYKWAKYFKIEWPLKS